MDCRQIAHETDIAYKQTFAKMEKREWGYLFCNPENPLHYDANHADLFSLPEDRGQIDAVIREVVEYFSGQQIFPRFYLYQWEPESEFARALRQHDFKVEELANPIQLWQGRMAEVAPSAEITIERVTADNYAEAMEVDCSISELGGAEVRAKAFELEFRHPAFQHYLLRCKGEPASIACIFRHEEYMRVENVATRSQFRGQGLIGHLLRHLQEEFIRSGAKHLWVFPINERVEKVYQRWGFDTMETITMGHAFLGGKGISELR